MTCKLNVSSALSSNISEVLKGCFGINNTDSQILLKLSDTDDNESQLEMVGSFIFSKFLNTTRTGSAHRQAGISIRTFLSSMAASVIYFLAQVLIFTILRGKLKYIYQAQVVQNGEVDQGIAERSQNLFTRSFSWIYIVICASSEKYREKVGLDAFFFLRFLRMLVIFFLTLSLLIIPILIPINYSSSAKSQTDEQTKQLPWLDKMNMSNLVAQKSSMLVFHSVLSPFVVVWFHALLIEELKYVRQIITPTRNEKSSSMFISRIPEDFVGDKSKIIAYFNQVFPDTVLDLKFLPKSHTKIVQTHRKILKIEKNLERIMMKIVVDKFFDSATKEAWAASNEASRTKYFVLLNKLTFHIKTPERYINYIQQFEWKKNESNNWFSWKSLRCNSISYVSQMYRSLERSARRYEKVNREWNQKCDDLLKWEDRTRDYGNRNLNNKVHLDQAFVKFNSMNVACALADLLEHGSDLKWKNALVVPELEDIVWHNISPVESTIKFLRTTLANFLSVFIIIGYILPVALIGLISQIPYVGSLLPLTQEKGRRSEFFNEVMAGVFPIITLIFLTEFVPIVFRWFSHLRCKKTGAAIEVDIQKWFFAFLFVHVFLVLTISSSLSIVVQKIVNNPVSIAAMLAHDLPKSSNFFCSFILLRGLAYSGGNLLQPKELFLEICYNLKVYIPHERIERMRNVPCFQWGSIYPIFSVLGCIGVVYSVICPLILPLSCLAFSLVLFSFKYVYEFQYYGNNVSETWGKLYPASLMQMYAGVYCMEFCMIGLLALANCYKLCFLNVLALGLTTLAHSQVSKHYLNRLYKFDMTEYQRPHLEENIITSPEDQQVKFPFIKDGRKAQIWVPGDCGQIAKREIQHLKHLYGIDSKIGEFQLTKEGSLSYQPRE